MSKQETKKDATKAAKTPFDMIIPSDPSLIWDLTRVISRRISMQTWEAYLLAGYVLFTWTHSLHRHCPRLMLWSPTPKCGKTDLLELLYDLVRHPLAAAECSEPTLFRACLEFDYPTFIIDEADVWLKGPNETQGALLNLGFNPPRTAVVLRQEKVGNGFMTRQFPVRGPMILGSYLVRPSGPLVRRTIIVELERAAPEWEPILPAKDDLVSLSKRCALWASKQPDMQDVKAKGLGEIDDTWRPLIAVAGRFGPDEEGHMRAVARAHVGEEDNVGVQLLTDIRLVMGEADGIWTTDLVSGLKKLEDRPWASKFDELTWGGKKDDTVVYMWLKRTLKGFKIESPREAFKIDRKSDAKPKRGYLRRDFLGAWGRWCPQPQGQQNQGFSQATQPLQP